MERNCENCKHYIKTVRNGMVFASCESWDCEYDPRDDEEKDEKGVKHGR